MGKRETKDERQLYIANTHNVYCSPDFIKLIKPRNLTWAGRRSDENTKFMWQNLKGRGI
jgi:hypothetical protein